MRVVLYARVSTRDKEQTPETQLFALRGYVAAQGSDWQVVREHVDQASATNFRDRTGWRELMDHIQKGKGGIDLVLVTKLDRAFRSVKETYDTLAFLDRHKIQFIATTQPDMNTSTSTGKLLLGMLAVVAEFERDLLRDRVQEGMARAKAEGKHIGRPKGSLDKGKRRRSGYFARYAD